MKKLEARLAHSKLANIWLASARFWLECSLMTTHQLRGVVRRSAKPSDTMWIIPAYVLGHWLLAFVADEILAD